eukprot:TRINITY_DN8717_c0_g2_i1.p1 TRINITY_DN8717_c0_g2~~TRINITY_DN8717_c0_g2_i1.p1  ORF type:complete len:755 (-),score=332.11 TRINITY_DN8717_c0_g2_i1:955-3219(-)
MADPNYHPSIRVSGSGSARPAPNIEDDGSSSEEDDSLTLKSMEKLEQLQITPISFAEDDEGGAERDSPSPLRNSGGPIGASLAVASSRVASAKVPKFLKLKDDTKRPAKLNLIKAIQAGDAKKVQSIIAAEKDLACCDVNDLGEAALSVAATNGQYAIVEFLLSHGALVDFKDFNQWTALLCAASGGHLGTCALLLAKGADPAWLTKDRHSVLHYLVRKQYEDRDSPSKKKISYTGLLEDLVVKRAVDVNGANYRGETPLMQAAGHGNETAVRFLLQNKADPDLKNQQGFSARSYAAKEGFRSIEAIFDQLDAAKRQKARGDLGAHIGTMKPDKIADMVEVMKHSNYALTLREHKSIFITHRDCFTASELVDWIVTNLGARSRQDAVDYAQQVLDGAWISPLAKTKTFKDSNSLYRFNERVVGTPLLDAHRPLKVSLEDFEPLKLLGKGGFGKVLLVQSKESGQLYAMKKQEKIRMGRDKDFKNLMTEKKILQNDSPFLVHLHYAFQTQTDFYLVMDFCGGRDLWHHLKTLGSFPEKIVKFITAELVLAISYLHANGILYRDLKPGNILLDFDGHICLADFGLSKEVLSMAAALHTACGTPTYSAPEVIEGSHYGKAIDWWSLGILMYQLLVGETPYRFEGDFRLFLKALYYKKVEYFSEVMSDNAINLIQQFLTLDPNDRLDEPDMIKRHPFFKGIDWDKLAVKALVSPIKIDKESVMRNLRGPLDEDFAALARARPPPNRPLRKLSGFTFVY